MFKRFFFLSAAATAVSSRARAARAARAAAGVLSAAVAVACGVDPGDAAAFELEGPQAELSEIAEEDIGTVESSIEGGFLSTKDDYSGLVRLWAVNTRFNELRQFCSGVLIENRLVLTAKHCLVFSAEEVAYGWPDTSSSTSRIFVSTDTFLFYALGSGPWYAAPNGADAAVFRLGSSLPVRTHNQIKWSGYRRPTANVNNGTAVLVTGFGPTVDGETSSICRYRSITTGERLRGCERDRWPGNAKLGLMYHGVQIAGSLVQNVFTLGGDSGGGVLWFGSGNTADWPVIGVNSARAMCDQVAGQYRCGAKTQRVDANWLWGF